MWRSFLLAIIPLALLWVWFFVADPMLILKPITKDIHITMTPHKGVESVLNFESQQPAEQFDSFIFGSSLTISTPAAEWVKYLPEGSRPYHFDASEMSLRQMCEYLEYLVTKADVRNLYIVLNPDLLKYDLHNFETAPQATGDMKYFRQLILKSWRKSVSPTFVLGFNAARRAARWDWILKYTNTEDLYVTENVEIQHPDPDLLEGVFTLKDMPFEEYKQRYRPVECEPVLEGSQREYLERFARLLAREGTDYRIAVVSAPRTMPLDGTVLMNPADSAVLREIFGDKFVSAQWPTLPWAYEQDATFDGYHFTAGSAVKLLKYVYNDSTRNAHPGRL